METMNAKQRKWKRHWVGEDAFKIFIPNHSLIGNVIEVGTGGLSFEYIPCYAVLGEGTELEFYFHDGFRLHVPPMRCRLTYDRPDRSKGSYYRIFEIRRAGAEFIPREKKIPASLRQLIDGRNDPSYATAAKAAGDPGGYFPGLPPLHLKRVR